jgi:hypothetical protein
VSHAACGHIRTAEPGSALAIAGPLTISGSALTISDAGPLAIAGPPALSCPRGARPLPPRHTPTTLAPAPCHPRAM